MKSRIIVEIPIRNLKQTDIDPVMDMVPMCACGTFFAAWQRRIGRAAQIRSQYIADLRQYHRKPWLRFRKHPNALLNRR